eukprot:58980_1
MGICSSKKNNLPQLDNRTNTLQPSTISSPSQSTQIKHQKIDTTLQFSKQQSASTAHSRVRSLSQTTEFELNELLREVLEEHNDQINDANTYAKQIILGNEKDEISEYRIDTMIQDINRQDSIIEEQKHISNVYDNIDDDDLITKIKEIKIKYAHKKNNSSLTDIIIDELKVTEPNSDKYIEWQQRIFGLIDWIQIDENMTPSKYNKKQSEIYKSNEFKQLQNESHKQMYELLKTKNIKDLKIECENKECRGNDKLAKDIFYKCECLKRIQLVLHIYQNYINNKKLWRKASFATILCPAKQRYDIQQLVDDFFHIKEIHIDNNNNKQNVANIICNQLENECKCNVQKC